MFAQQFKGLQLVVGFNFPFCDVPIFTGDHFHFNRSNTGCIIPIGFTFNGRFIHINYINGVQKRQFCDFLNYPILIDTGSAAPFSHSSCDSILNVGFCKVFATNIPCGLGRIPGPNCRLRCVQVNQIFFNKSLLLFGQGIHPL
uniref:Uncharacterized protein n=1 Tax=Siphoviridae sp. ct3es5 TaxID=2825322 RepID=A0A8S5PVL5_9CAUD|nr:MAG TPA: hypothetical protein [Siphoviridae sp. ct3es5]